MEENRVWVVEQRGLETAQRYGLGLAFFDPEDEEDIFLQNVRLPLYT
jgi:hypothetical protein